MRIDVVTIFPGMFAEVLSCSILKIAREKKLVEINLHNLRDFSLDKHSKVDDRPFGGGPGMVIKPEPVFRAMEYLAEKEGLGKARKILLSPQGKVFSQKMALELSKEPNIVLLSGHYEGFDERITKLVDFEEVSIGDYVLSGGEVPAMVIIDAVVRLLPGVLGNPLSAEQESFSDGLLDCPQYTRPRSFKRLRVPEVLLSGDHKRIEEWRRKQALKKTRLNRKDLVPKKSKK